MPSTPSKAFWSLRCEWMIRVPFSAGDVLVCDVRADWMTIALQETPRPAQERWEEQVRTRNSPHLVSLASLVSPASLAFTIIGHGS